MPQVAVAAIAAAGTTYITAGSLAAMSMITFAKHFALNLVLSYATSALSPKPKMPDMGLNGRNAQFKQPITAHDVVYGETRQTGPLVYAELTGDDKYLHMVIPLAGHVCDSVTEYYVNDTRGQVGASGWYLHKEWCTASTNVNATAAVDGNVYEIVTTGTTDFTAIGAPDSEVGTMFEANGAGTGTGVLKRYLPLIRINMHFGQDGSSVDANGNPIQAADQDLIDELEEADVENGFTSAHKLNGITYAYIRLEHNRDVFASGIPAFSFLLRGAKVKDATDLDADARWSANPIDIMYDYLTNPDYGLGCSADELDEDIFASAAGICNEQIIVPTETFEPSEVVVGNYYAITSLGDTDWAAMGVSGTPAVDDVFQATAVGSGTGECCTVEYRYTTHGILDTAETPKSNLQKITSSMGGNLVYGFGKFYPIVGMYYAPTKTLTLDDIRGDIQVQTRTSRQSSYNAVKGVFASPISNYQPTDYPAYRSAEFVTVDGGETRWLDVSLPMTTSNATAQRISKLNLYREREQIGVAVQCGLGAMDLAVGDTVALNLPRYGVDWQPKNFTVLSWSIAPSPQGEFAIQMQLKETSSTVDDWDGDESAFEASAVTLGTTRTVVAPSLTVSDELRAFQETAVTALTAKVASTSAVVTDFEVEAIRTSTVNAANMVNNKRYEIHTTGTTDFTLYGAPDSNVGTIFTAYVSNGAPTGSGVVVEVDYTSLGRASGNNYELNGVEDGATYEVRAKAYNGLGNGSEWVTQSHQVVGKAFPPQDVTGFEATVNGDTVQLNWIAVPDLDLSHYRIRHTPNTSSPVFSDATDILLKVPRPATSCTVPALTGTYFIKAVDKIGKSSVNPTSTSIVSTTVGQNLTLDQTITESPSFPGIKVNCVETSGTLILQNSSTGYYEFVGTGGYRLDLGNIYEKVILKAHVLFNRFDPNNLFDNAPGNFDDREGTFDGDTGANNDVNAYLTVACSDDNSTYTDFQRIHRAEFSGRYFRFRLQLEGTGTGSDVISPQITELSVDVDMPDRTEVGGGVSNASSATTVVFANAFKTTPTITATLNSGNTGDTCQVYYLSRTGFSMYIRDSGNNIVQRNYTYSASGYGKES